GDAVWSIAYVNTSDPQNLLSDIHSLFPLAKADTIGSYIENLYGRTVSNITRASKAAFAAAMAIELILLSLISSLMVSRERRTVTLKLAVGIRRCRIIAAYVGRLCIATMSGIALGIISSGILGPMVLSLMLSFLGASGVRFSASHVFAFVFLPLSMILLAAVSSVLGALTVFRIRPCEIRSNA
ncbi:MAG: hypothetical protein ACI4NM_09360, partial [Bullifex sp.]